MARTKITESEIAHIIIAILILSLVIGFQSIVDQSFSALSTAILFAAIIIILNVGAKKLTANALDSGVEHKIWSFSRYGFKPGSRFKNEFPAGIVLPLLFSVITLGIFKLMTLLTYETKTLKHRAAKRFGHYNFTEMTDWHNALIGAAGIIVLLALSLVSYFIPASNLEFLARMASYYAFFNLLPIGRLDGTQIYFGSRALYAVLAAITLIFTAYSFLLV